MNNPPPNPPQADNEPGIAIEAHCPQSIRNLKLFFEGRRKYVRDSITSMKVELVAQEWLDMKAQLSELRAKNEALEAEAGAMREALEQILKAYPIEWIESGIVNKVRQAHSSTAGQSILDEVARLRIQNKSLQATVDTVAHWPKEEALTAAKARVATLENALHFYMQAGDKVARRRAAGIAKKALLPQHSHEFRGKDGGSCTTCGKTLSELMTEVNPNGHAALAKNEGEEGK